MPVTEITTDAIESLRGTVDDERVALGDGVVEKVRDMIQPAAELALKMQNLTDEIGLSPSDEDYATDSELCATVIEAAMAGTTLFGIQIGIMLAEEAAGADVKGDEVGDESPKTKFFATDYEPPAPAVEGEGVKSTKRISVEDISAAAEHGTANEIDFTDEADEYLLERFSLPAKVGIESALLATSAYRVGFGHGVAIAEQD